MNHQDECVCEENLKSFYLRIPEQVHSKTSLRFAADQIYGDEEMHEEVRRLCMDYMEKNTDYFSQFVTENFCDYIARKRRRDAHGNHIELQAISEIFSRPIEIYEYSTEPRNITGFRRDGTAPGGAYPPIRLSYHGSVHYNSVVDPKKPTVGIGLGLPGYALGSGSTNLMSKMAKNSDVQMLEDAMLSDKINLTDMEQTEREIVAHRPYLEYLKRIDKVGHAFVDDSSEVSSASEPGCSRSVARAEASKGNAFGTSQNFYCHVRIAAVTTCVNQYFLQFSFFVSLGCYEWLHAATTDDEESALLAQVMALSKHEFLNSLDKNSSKDGNDEDKACSSKSN
ncbi:unnamed protein product [Gongylonema pulchrum]|uniref:ubiquitinyl hydrolase 1 n=1 Tax=Gongylonema pulchrum TaxID=637853 RepID=A0A183DPD9_9BILA|nr:unnamed protein product [Gongylonema pulchrum]